MVKAKHAQVITLYTQHIEIKLNFLVNFYLGIIKAINNVAELIWLKPY